METKKNSNRGRPKKDYWELKNKIAQEAAENKWKLGRWRPKKQKNIDDSINTKISNHSDDIAVLEQKNNKIHEHILTKHTILKTKTENNEQNEREKRAEKYSKVALIFSVLFCILAILYWLISHKIQNNEVNISEINNTWNIQSENTEQNIEIQIWYNDGSGNFVEMENIEISKDEWINNNIDSSDNISNSDIDLIKSFYDKINNKEFSELSKLTDRYLKDSTPYKTYFNANRLRNFLDKIAGNKVYIWWFSEKSSDKPNVKYYWYIMKYKLNNENTFRQEDREIAIVERNWEKLIWSIMCVTTGCSRMPFFQK